jgi:hypothetical protein
MFGNVLGLGIQAVVVDGQRNAVGQVFHQRNVVVRQRLLLRVASQREGSEYLPPRTQRSHDDTPRAQPLEHLRLCGVEPAAVIRPKILRIEQQGAGTAQDPGKWIRRLGLK